MHLLRSLVPYLASCSVAAAAAVRSPASGCGLAPPCKPGNFHEVLTDKQRLFKIWVPATYHQKTSTPLILSYHGANGTVDRQSELDLLYEPEFNKDHIVVWLQGLNTTNGVQWEGAPGVTFDDVGFTSDVLAYMDSHYCIDKRRTYATGKSQGGGFVNRLACDAELSTRFAAFAPVSGAYYISVPDLDADCHPATISFPCNTTRHDTPLLAFHGGADPTISYTGGTRWGGCLPDIYHWSQQWAVRDKLASVPETHPISGSDSAKKYVYGPGLVTLVYDGDSIPHDWPSTTYNADNEGQNYTSFNATPWIMDFFGRYKLPEHYLHRS